MICSIKFYLHLWVCRKIGCNIFLIPISFKLDPFQQLRRTAPAFAPMRFMSNKLFLLRTLDMSHHKYFPQNLHFNSYFVINVSRNLALNLWCRWMLFVICTSPSIITCICCGKRKHRNSCSINMFDPNHSKSFSALTFTISQSDDLFKTSPCFCWRGIRITFIAFVAFQNSDNVIAFRYLRT